MKLFLNIVWCVFGGMMIAVEYVISSLTMMITIIGIPFGLQTLKLAILALWPFGTQIIENRFPSGCLAVMMNIIWWIVGGIPIALSHLGWGILFCITIVGIPFGMQHFKLMRLAMFPFGNTIK